MRSSCHIFAIVFLQVCWLSTLSEAQILSFDLKAFPNPAAASLNQPEAVGDFAPSIQLGAHHAQLQVRASAAATFRSGQSGHPVARAPGSTAALISYELTVQGPGYLFVHGESTVSATSAGIERSDATTKAKASASGSAGFDNPVRWGSLVEALRVDNRADFAVGGGVQFVPAGNPQEYLLNLNVAADSEAVGMIDPNTPSASAAESYGSWEATFVKQNDLKDGRFNPNTPFEDHWTDDSMSALAREGDSHTTYIVIHGWNAACEPPTTTSANTLCFDWRDGAGGSAIEAYAEATRQGLVLAAKILASGVDPSTLHLVAHSYGFQTAGIAGQEIFRVTGKRIGDITAIDIPLTNYGPQYPMVGDLHTDSFTRVRNIYGAGITSTGRAIAGDNVVNLVVPREAMGLGTIMKPMHEALPIYMASEIDAHGDTFFGDLSPGNYRVTPGGRIEPNDPHLMSFAPVPTGVFPLFDPWQTFNAIIDKDHGIAHLVESSPAAITTYTTLKGDVLRFSYRATVASPEDALVVQFAGVDVFRDNLLSSSSDGHDRLAEVNLSGLRGQSGPLTVMLFSGGGLGTTITIRDMQFLQSVSFAGDANSDGRVDLDDFGILKFEFGATGDSLASDYDRNRKIDLSDFGVLKTQFGAAGPTPLNVPEPSTLHLCSAFLLVLCLWFFRQQAHEQVA